MLKLNKSALLLICFFTAFAVECSSDRLDPNLPHYRKVPGISGNLSSVGSDTLANLMTFWGEDFKRLYPNVNLQIQAAGSSTAPPALIEGTANLGPMSREMKSRELASFEQKYGYKPMAIPVAIDALAIYVNKDNPISGLTMAQVDAIFSLTRKCSNTKQISNWQQLGIEGLGDIQLYGRNSVSGTYGYFKGSALCQGDFKSSVNEQPGSAAVVQAISKSRNGIGYSGIGYKTSGVRSVPLAKDDEGEFVEATAANALDRSFPLSRYLYLYVNKHPNKPLPPLEREFVKMILSASGQENVIKDGYVPLPSGKVEQLLQLIE
ncbi:MAG: phosphate ABC transporter substrate-binding protein PstS family protein [Kangiellaceae bacterium]|jgi:phosphate transport system substrate-binding protein|nr:phosphate ABC transporter substrate-binding protein PstS family protein [Kangiellaceae bacterium]